MKTVPIGSRVTDLIVRIAFAGIAVNLIAPQLSLWDRVIACAALAAMPSIRE